MNEYWRKEYEANYPRYREITQSVQQRLQQLLQSPKLHIHQIDSRIKTTASLENKLRRKANRYRSLTDITDICGIRIITYYADEIDIIASRIRAAFSIDEPNSVDKRRLLKPNAFGYLSLHLILSIPGASGQTAPHCKIEVQIRSILQHAWAAIEHELAYKNPAAPNNDLRRSFSRLAGMLESVDLEFMRIRKLTRREKIYAAETRAVTKSPQAPLKHVLAAFHKFKARYHPGAAISLGASCILLTSAAIAAAISVYCSNQAAIFIAQLTHLIKNV